MRLNEDGLEIKGWQFCLIVGVVALLIISISANTMFNKTIELEKAKVVEAEETKRGHWLWGHWDDVAEKQ